MKIAICMSGEPRTLEYVYSSHQIHLLEPYNPDIYISTVNIEGGWTSWNNITRSPKKVDIDNLVSKYNPVAIEIYDKKYDPVVPSYVDPIHPEYNAASGSWHQYYRWFRSFNMLHDPDHYDIIMKLRFDYLIDECDRPLELLNKNKLISYTSRQCPGPFHDKFFYGAPSIMERMMTVWKYLPEYWKNGIDKSLTAEDLLSRYVIDMNIPVEHIRSTGNYYRDIIRDVTDVTGKLL